MTPGAQSSPRTQALVVGAAAGTVSSVVALVAYFILPLTAESYIYGFNGMEATYAVLVYFFAVEPLYHATVLVGVPFATTRGAFFVARRWGVANRELDAAIIGGVLFVPFTTIWVAMIVAVVVIGITNAPVFMLFALLFGVPITILLSGFVILVNVAGAIGGYALVRLLARVRAGSVERN